MFRTLRLIIRIVAIFFVGLLILAYFTNPTMEEFKQEAKYRFSEMIDSQTDNPTLKLISSIGIDFADNVVEKMVIRQNYYFCSIYTVQLPDGDYKFLGVFHQFIPLQSKNPFDVLIPKAGEHD